MIVVVDSSPLIVLVNIGQIQILPALFREVYLPPQDRRGTRRSKTSANHPRIHRREAAVASSAGARTVESIPELHEGERAAISLATELKADLLLIDENSGRSAARARHLPITGTIGILERAAEQGMLDLATAFEQIKKTDFWISPRLLDAELEKHRARRPDRPE